MARYRPAAPPECPSVRDMYLKTCALSALVCLLAGDMILVKQALPYLLYLSPIHVRRSKRRPT